MKDRNGPFIEVIAIAIFTVAIIFNAYLATKKLENRKKNEHFQIH